jgi:hypothetical protein
MIKRASYIGITSAFQADEVGSIPTARSTLPLNSAGRVADC